MLDLLKHLPSDSIENTLIYSDLRADRVFLSELASLSREINCIPIRMQADVAPIKDSIAIRRLALLFREHRFDIIHTHSGKGGLLGRVAAKISRQRAAVVYTPNASPFRLNRLYWLAELALSHMCDKIIAVTESEREELITNRIGSSEKVVTINSGIDVGWFSDSPISRSEIRRKLTVEDHHVLIGTAGRICAQKAPLVFVRMADTLASQLPGARFVWIGDGELKQDLAAEFEKRGLTKVFRVTGFLEDIRSYLSALDVFCLLSDYESLGYVTLEAMALGLPAVGTRVAGTTDVIRDGETGFLVPRGDHEQAAFRVLELCKSPSLRSEMGSKGQDRVKTEFSVQTMATQTAGLYCNLIPWARTSVRQRVRHCAK